MNCRILNITIARPSTDTLSCTMTVAPPSSTRRLPPVHHDTGSMLIPVSSFLPWRSPAPAASAAAFTSAAFSTTASAALAACSATLAAAPAAASTAWLAASLTVSGAACDQACPLTHSATRNTYTAILRPAVESRGVDPSVPHRIAVPFFECACSRNGVSACFCASDRTVEAVTDYRTSFPERGIARNPL